MRFERFFKDNAIIYFIIAHYHKHENDKMLSRALYSFKKPLDGTASNSDEPKMDDIQNVLAL